MGVIKYLLVVSLIFGICSEVAAKKRHRQKSDEEDVPNPWQKFLEIMSRNIKEGERFFKEMFQKQRKGWKHGMRGSDTSDSESDERDGEPNDGKRKADLLPGFKNLVRSLQCENSPVYQKFFTQYTRALGKRSTRDNWLKDLAMEVNEQYGKQSCAPISCSPGGAPVAPANSPPANPTGPPPA